MKRSLAITAASVTMLASACITDQALWGSCNPAGDPWGTDGHWVLYCDKGEWVPTMTAQEFVDISSGKNVTIGTLPTKPVPTTTSTTSTSTSTTSTSTTTSTTIPAAVTVDGVSGGATLDVAGGEQITIHGTNLTGATSVLFDRSPDGDFAGSYSVQVNAGISVDVAGSNLTLTTPEVDHKGAYVLKVTTPAGTFEGAGGVAHYTLP